MAVYCRIHSACGLCFLIWYSAVPAFFEASMVLVESSRIWLDRCRSKDWVSTLPIKLQILVP